MKPPRMHIHVTTKMSGKMMGMVSINTDTLSNGYCASMREVHDAVCTKCYSWAALQRYKTASACFERNSELLSERLIPLAELPLLNHLTVRLNAHGELVNGMHMANIIGMCKRNPRTTFTLWSKRKDIVAKVIRDFGKPKNLILIYSAPKLDTVAKLPTHFDKVFTVYTKQYAKDNDTPINCGTKKCIDCMTCYTLGNDTRYIHELKK